MTIRSDSDCKVAVLQQIRCLAIEDYKPKRAFVLLNDVEVTIITIDLRAYQPVYVTNCQGNMRVIILIVVVEVK